MDNQTKKQIIEFNFIRFFSIFGILTYHFACYSNAKLSYLISVNKLVDWGSTFVTIFFLISGMLLYKNNDIATTHDLKKFYLKRFFSIFPSFYIAYLITMFINCLINPNFFIYLKIQNPLIFLYSLTGLDGYLESAGFKTFALFHEWFIGAIVILYIIYPILSHFINKYFFSTIILITSLFLLTSNLNMNHPSSFRNLFSCLFSFVLGIALMKTNLYKNKIIQSISFIIFFVIFFLPVKLNYSLACHISGFTLFYILFFIAEHTMKNKIFIKIINFLSNISFEIYLIHHCIILSILAIFNPTEKLASFIILLFITSVVVSCAFYLKNISKFIFKAKN